VSLLRALRESSERAGAAGREALAIARQFTLLHRDVPTVTPANARELVVLVHGFLATPGVLRPLREHLEAEGHAVASFTHPPGIGVEELARRVGELVAGARAERVQLVGHSIGGLAARWYVQALGGDPRVVQTVSLASPFWGAWRARLVPGPLARDLHPESALLARLRAGIGRGVPHFAVSGSHDSVVGPAQPLGSARELVAEGCGHNALLYDARVLAEVAGCIRAHAAGDLREPAL
jgi:pimeloyl-ACP methyl ester carboxylesterase